MNKITVVAVGILIIADKIEVCSYGIREVAVDRDFTQGSLPKSLFHDRNAGSDMLVARTEDDKELG